MGRFEQPTGWGEGHAHCPLYVASTAALAELLQWASWAGTRRGVFWPAGGRQLGGAAEGAPFASAACRWFMQFGRAVAAQQITAAARITAKPPPIGHHRSPPPAISTKASLPCLPAAIARSERAAVAVAVVVTVTRSARTACIGVAWHGNAWQRELLPFLGCWRARAVRPSGLLSLRVDRQETRDGRASDRGQRQGDDGVGRRIRGLGWLAKRIP